MSLVGLGRATVTSTIESHTVNAPDRLHVVATSFREGREGLRREEEEGGRERDRERETETGMALRLDSSTKSHYNLLSCLTFVCPSLNIHMKGTTGYDDTRRRKFQEDMHTSCRQCGEDTSTPYAGVAAHVVALPFPFCLCGIGTRAFVTTCQKCNNTYNAEKDNGRWFVTCPSLVVCDFQGHDNLQDGGCFAVTCCNWCCCSQPEPDRVNQAADLENPILSYDEPPIQSF